MRLCIFALFFVLFASSAAAKPDPGNYVVHVIDVGTGLSIFVEGADFTLLYDAGSNDDTARGDRNRVLAYLRAIRPDLRRIDHVILSHPHVDHTELMPDVLAAYEVSNIWDSGAFNPICSYQLFLEGAANEAGAIYHHATGRPGPHEASFPARTCYGHSMPATTVSMARSVPITSDPIPLGLGASMRVLYANGTVTNFFHEANLVVRLDLGSRHVLLPGDAEAGGRRPPADPPDPGSVVGRLLACCATDLRADVLIAPHHGSKTSTRVAFLDAVNANIYVVSSGPRVYAGLTLPDGEVVAEYESRGTVWRTDRNDYRCGQSPAKIGPDDDGRPGGCDNVRISIDRAGTITAAYYERAD